MGEAVIAYGRAEIASFLFETSQIDIEFERNRFRGAQSSSPRLQIGDRR